MMPPTPGLRHLLRTGVLVVSLGTSLALADDYSPVTQLIGSGQLVEAMQKADQYLATNPRDPQMRFIKGLIQQDSGKTADAIATYVRLSEDYPELPEPYNNVAVLYAAQGQLERARGALEAAIRASRSYAVAHENLGDVYARLAAQAYGQAQQLDTANAALAPKLSLVRQLIATGTAARAPAPQRARPPTPAASASR